MSKTAKWWFISCGGCLAVILLMGLVMVLAGGACVSGLQQMGAQASKNIFGEDYQPEGYMVIMAVPIPASGPGEARDVMMMGSLHTGTLIIATDAVVSESTYDKVRRMDQPTVEETITRLQFFSEENENQIVSVHNLGPVTIGGKAMMAAHVVMKDDEGYEPGAVILVAQPKEKLVCLLATNSSDPVSSPDEVSAEAQAVLLRELEELVEASPLDEKAP